MLIGIPGHSDSKQASLEVVNELVASHVLALLHKGKLLDILLIVGLLAGRVLVHEVHGLGLVLVVDQLQVHVDKHGVQDQSQLVFVLVQRVLDETLQITEKFT